VSLSGTSLGPDSGANEKLYGKKVSGEQIWSDAVKAPPSAQEILAVLSRKSTQNESAGKSGK
jgi:lipid-binding SYLF domain-containing protein